MKPIISLLASLFVLVASTHAAVPKLINFQGRLTDSNGQPADAHVSISLRVYDAENAGQLTYSENIGTVEVINGIYSFRFGSPVFDPTGYRDLWPNGWRGSSVQLHGGQYAYADRKRYHKRWNRNLDGGGKQCHATGNITH